MITQIYLRQSQVDRSVFRKDILDRIKLKNRKREFKASPESKEKIVTLFKFTN